MKTRYIPTKEHIKKIIETRRKRGSYLVTEKTKQKMRISMKGKNTWSKGRKRTKEEVKKSAESRTGLKRSQIAIEKTRKALTGKKRPEISGKNHYLWIKDRTIFLKNQQIRSSIEYDLWRSSVFARDGYTCQKYGTIGGKLVSHHILNFSNHIELRFAIDNGITLSEKAHKEFHKKYGTKNNTREQIEEFLKN